MARFKHPEVGTVIECDGDLAEHYKALGWVDDEPSPRRSRRAKGARDASGSTDTGGPDTVRPGSE